MTRISIALAAVALSGTAAFSGVATAAASTTARPSAVHTEPAAVDRYSPGLDMCRCMEIEK